MSKITFTLFLAFFWGLAWAAYLQLTEMGRFLAIKRGWLTVVVGVGGDLLIALLVMPRRAWVQMVTIIAASSLPIITRSLINELSETNEVISVIKNAPRK
jgi:hypothetical protein